MSNHVVEVLENHDHKFLLGKRTNPHIDLSMNLWQLSPYDHAHDLLPMLAWNPGICRCDNPNKPSQIQFNSKLIETTTRGCVNMAHSYLR